MTFSLGRDKMAECAFVVCVKCRVGRDSVELMPWCLCMPYILAYPFSWFYVRRAISTFAMWMKIRKSLIFFSAIKLNQIHSSENSNSFSILIGLCVCHRIWRMSIDRIILCIYCCRCEYWKIAFNDKDSVCEKKKRRRRRREESEEPKRRARKTSSRCFVHAHRDIV